MKNIALRKARLEMGFTQEKLAKMLGYKGRQAVSNWENGYIKPPLKVALKVSEILGKDPAYLFLANQVQESQTPSKGVDSGANTEAE